MRVRGDDPVTDRLLGPGGRLLWPWLIIVFAVSACIGVETKVSSLPSTSTTHPMGSTTTVSPPTSPPTVARSQPGVACVPGAPRAGIDVRFGDLIRFYNQGNERALTAFIGEGPVIDPSLQPEGPDRYESVAEWLATAARLDDVLSADGYGMGEPFELFVVRQNPSLHELGIDRLSLTLRLWANQDCEVRIEAGENLVSHPDPCLYHSLYQRGGSGSRSGCDAPFDPRAAHVAVWTGIEVLIYGGSSGSASTPPLTSGLAFSPSSRTWRSMAPSPRALGFWPTAHAVWTGTEMIVVGNDLEADRFEIVVMSYSPAEDEWSVSPPAPEERRAVGGMVWTGSEVILAGGDLNNPDASAWAYSPAAETWRRLPDPDIPEVEGAEGVWTGSEAVFLGGYAHPGMTIATSYDPATDTWRQLAQPDQWFDFHELAWTGEQIIVYSGNIGPGHRDRVLLYDPETDRWSESSKMPIQPAARLAGAWTGDRLLIWGGYATYGDTHDPLLDEGAVYYPNTDTWSVLPPSPLAPRCDHSGTWTGEELIVFGGMLTCGHPQQLADGNAASYRPATGRWVLLEDDS